MIIKEILNNGIKVLNEKHIDEASFLTRMLLCNVLNIRKEELIVKLEDELEEIDILNFLKRSSEIG